MKLQDTQKQTLFSILTKYDNVYPTLGDALSKTLQGTASNSDIDIVDGFICSNKLDEADKTALDKIYIGRILELNF